MSKAKVSLTEEKATLLITLLAKAEESVMPDSILKDRFAADVIAQIDYDFSKIKLNRNTTIGLALRANVLDKWVRQFISDHPNATILNIGCGLDSRVFRVDPPSTVNWIDVDYPEVIDLRTAFYPSRGMGYSKIGTSVTAPGWMEHIEVTGPTMVVAEGLLYYLSQSEVDALFERIVNHFKHGELTFDVYRKTGVKLVNANAAIRATGAVLNWSIDDPREIEFRNSSFKLIEKYNAYDSPHTAKMSFAFRLVLATFGKTAAFRKLVQLLRYRF